MDFSALVQGFYGGERGSSRLQYCNGKKDIAKYFITIASGSAYRETTDFSDSMFIKWFDGEYLIRDSIWNTMALQFDEGPVAQALFSRISDGVLILLMGQFQIKLNPKETPNKMNFATAIAKQFKAIIDGCGEAEDIVAECYYELRTAGQFPAYIKNSYDKYSKLKTLLYTSEEHQFDEVFVCNTVVPGYPIRASARGKEAINNVTLSKLRLLSPCAILVGMGGIGKTMMMRHLFLSSIKDMQETGRMPILVTLREFGSERHDLLSIIANSVSRFDPSFSLVNAKQVLSRGSAEVLLDGLDEIKATDMEDFLRQLEALVDKYPENQYVISSRRFSSFVGLSRFKIFSVRPFTLEQALELVDKLDFCPEEPRVKQQFREQVEKELYKTHREFVTNPLLLTLMLMNYRRFAEVPEKKYLFYEQAYQTLLQRHDADKLAYRRDFRSVKEKSDFTRVFREFCAKSYRKGDFEFDQAKVSSYFDRLNAKKRINLATLTVDNFLFDACHNACLMYEEAGTYHFLHRSFQEYFFADYYSRQDDETMRKLGRWLAGSYNSYFDFIDDTEALDMLYDLDPEKVERFIFLPFLSPIFSESAGQYWRFWESCCHDWKYTIGAENVPWVTDLLRDEPNNDVRINELISLLLRILEVPSLSSLRCDTHNLSSFPELIHYLVYGEAMQVSDSEIDYVPVYHVPKKDAERTEMQRAIVKSPRIATDENGNPLVLGYVYSFDFSLARTAPDRYAKILDVWKAPDTGAYAIYSVVKNYYYDLKKRLDEQDMLDDDF